MPGVVDAKLNWGWTYAHQMATGDPRKPDHNRSNGCPWCVDVEALDIPSAPAMGATNH